MLECYEIENIEQLRAIADMLRVRIVDLLQKKPMTVTQLGEELGLAPAKVHYHVRELEKVGLLHLAETREKGGILEKYYQPIAREISVEKSLLSAPPDEALAMISTWLNQIKDGFQQAFRRALEQRALEQKEVKPNLSIGFTHIYLSPEEQQQLFKQIGELLRPYEERRGIEGEQEMASSLIVYPVGASLTRQQPPTLQQVALPSSEKTWTIGAAGYNRADLEKLLAEGRRLHLNVIGVCRFADDVSADIAERAIEHFEIVGKLIASNGVREVLMAKS